MRLLVLLLIVGSLSACAQTPAAETETWTPNYNQADIYEFIGLVQEATGKTFVVDPRVQGKVTIVNSKALNSEELFKLLEATLETNGYTAVEVNNIVRIFPKDDAKTKPLPQGD